MYRSTSSLQDISETVDVSDDFPSPQALNILLQSQLDNARGVVAKVADFGLSVQMNNAETHVSGLYQGTLSHMAPEVLLNGAQSNASDV